MPYRYQAEIPTVAVFISILHQVPIKETPSIYNMLLFDVNRNNPRQKCRDRKYYKKNNVCIGRMISTMYMDWENLTILERDMWNSEILHFNFFLIKQTIFYVMIKRNLSESGICVLWIVECPLAHMLICNDLSDLCLTQSVFFHANSAQLSNV